MTKGTDHRRAIVLVLDGVGVGDAEDADRFGDEGSNTLGHIDEEVCGLSLPHMAQLGLAHIIGLRKHHPNNGVGAYWGRMKELSDGKDSTTGHWELCGCRLDKGFTTFPKGFSTEIIDELKARWQVENIYCNRPASGTGVIEEFGEQHQESGWPIVYTSADPVLQIAAHEQVIDLEKLYGWCESAFPIARQIGLSRVIARPFVGSAGSYQRTAGRRDFSVVPPKPTLIDILNQADIPVIGIGKVDNLFANRGFAEAHHTKNNDEGVDILIEQLRRKDGAPKSFIFCNLVDFDTEYGHRNDVKGFASALERFDSRVQQIITSLAGDDLLFMTADHGNDPTHPGTDHTREQVPLLVMRGDQVGSVEENSDRCLGVREGFHDVAATLCEFFEAPNVGEGKSFYSNLYK